MPDVKLKINNSEYSGWESMRISRSIEQISGTFELTVSDKWPGIDSTREIKTGHACEVLINSSTVINGYVDDVTPSFGTSDHTISVSGRDKTGDLVDCSAVYKTGEWSDRNILQIAKDLCDPFGITVSSNVDYGAVFKKWSIQESETVYECIERAARIRGLLLVSDGSGGLLITRASSDRIETGLIEGENLLSGSRTFTWRDRFSKYTIKSQNAGFDDSTPDQNSGPRGEAVDNTVNRYRPLIIIAEDQGDTAKLNDRAKWEKNVRAGKSSRINVSVQGWSHKAGLWEPNKMVRITSDKLTVDKDMLIVSVGYSLDRSGSITNLALCDREAFDLIELPAPEEGVWAS